MKTKFRYFPQDSRSKGWGLRVCDVGWQRTSPHDDYPWRRHPDGYYYTWKTGRRLSEYQLCFVFSGGGIAEFEPGRPVALSSGTILLIAPGRWHRCKPDPETGWGALWIGFSGSMAQSIVRDIFHRDGCLAQPIGKADEFRHAAIRLVARLVKSGEGRPYSSAGDLMSLLGQLAEGAFDENPAGTNFAAVRQAQSVIAARFAEWIDFRELARSVGMGYDSFRHLFAKVTGFSPLQFQIAERLRTARNLIANTNLPMMEIAKRTGFASATYFTRVFKAEAMMTPLEYRKSQLPPDAAGDDSSQNPVRLLDWVAD